jgi:hypothetical protein
MSIVRVIQSEPPESGGDQLEVGKDVVIRERHRWTEVTLEFSGPCSYTFASRIDEDWIRIVTALADFESGPVVVTSGGEDYEESGPRIWQIGPERRVLTSGIRKRKAEIRLLRKEITHWRRARQTAGFDVKVIGK